jgi:hypothetical protein
MTEEQIIKFILENNWSFAKTMSDIPHWYIVKQKCTSRFLFMEFVKYIRAKGYEQAFYSKKFVYCNIGEYKYWTMGAPVEETTIINRALINK